MPGTNIFGRPKIQFYPQSFALLPVKIAPRGTNFAP